MPTKTILLNNLEPAGGKRSLKAIIQSPFGHIYYPSCAGSFFKSKAMSYHKKTKAYIKKVIRIRKHLIASGANLMNEALAWQHINHLEKYLKAYSYNDDYLMAGFWRRNASRIMELIPGSKSSSHMELVHEFNDIDSMTMLLDAPKNKMYVYR